MTPIGLIPEDWDVLSISDVGQDFSYGVGAEAVPFNGEDKYIRITDIDDESHRYNPNPVVSPSYFSENHLLKKNDIVVARTGASVGKSYLYNRRDGKLVFAGFLMKFNVSNVDARYVAYHFSTKRYWQWVNSESARTGQPGLNIQQLKQFSFPIPTDTKEQQKIADALSGVDDIISALDEAIAKKRQIKEGLMQQLLTGKTRLPGFSDEWEELELGSILSYEQPGPFLVHSTDYVDSGVPVLTAGKTFILGYTNEDFGIYNSLPVIIFDDFVTESKYVDFPFKAKSSAMKMLSVRDKDRHNIRFVYEVMQLIDFPMTDHKRWWIAEYSHLKVSVPASLEEENAIAKAFSTIDREIHVFEAQREKYTLIKQGMMQELLTGKTRLV